MAGGIDNAYQGTSAEHAVASLLARHFTIAKPIPDIGIDWIGYPKPPSGSRTTFYFQVKSGHRFRAERRRIADWIGLLESGSVILVHGREVSASSHLLRFLVLHDWAIQNPDWAQQPIDRYAKDSVNLLKYFQRIDDSGENFVEALAAEARRVERHPGAMWRTLHSWRLALGESDLFYRFGQLGQAEVPVSLKEEALAKRLASTDIELHQFLRGLWRLPEEQRRNIATEDSVIHTWLAGTYHQPAKGQADFELAQFAKFVRAMRDFDGERRFEMPGHSARETRAWRVFCTLYPESFRLLEHVLRYPAHWSNDQRMTAMILTAALANSGDELLGDQAKLLLGSLSDQFPSRSATGYEAFDITKAYFYNMAEAFGGRHVDRAVEFVKRNAGPNGELELLAQREYYQADDSFTRESMLRKIENPRSRDINVRKLNELTMEFMESGKRSPANRRTR